MRQRIGARFHRPHPCRTAPYLGREVPLRDAEGLALAADIRSSHVRHSSRLRALTWLLIDMPMRRGVLVYTALMPQRQPRLFGRQRELQKAVGGRVKAAREARDLTQEGLARSLQLDPRTAGSAISHRTVVADIEGGRRRLELAELEALAQVLGCAMRDLLLPLLGPEVLDEKAVSEVAADIQRLFVAEVGQRLAEIRAPYLEALRRPAVDEFESAAVGAAGYLSDAELAYETQRFRVWTEDAAGRRAPEFVPPREEDHGEAR